MGRLFPTIGSVVHLACVHLDHLGQLHSTCSHDPVYSLTARIVLAGRPAAWRRERGASKGHSKWLPERGASQSEDRRKKSADVDHIRGDN
jgi:hypothetical protein